MQNVNYPTSDVLQTVLERPAIDLSELTGTIDEIFQKVRLDKDQALINYTEKFDKVSLDTLILSEKEINNAIDQVEEVDRECIQIAYDNIYKFHIAQKRHSDKVETSPGVECWSESRAIGSVGLYIPGGSAPLFSTVLMLGIPASIAGCEQVSIATPPQADGTVHPLIVYCAKLCGIERIYKVGGAQAIAALTLGTETVKSVDKIFGPGNQYVTAAKMKATQLGLAIDFPAGPSELLVYTNATSNPAFVASDLLSQAEHGPDSQVILLGTDEAILKQVQDEIDIQLLALPRIDIAKKALSNSKCILVKDENEALDCINQYGPEHLILAVNDTQSLLPSIKNAGSVFLGHFTPESAGDYASGTNHTLPTNGFAKVYSGVNLDAFTKRITFQEITQTGLKSLSKVIMRMAQQEQLEAHKNAVKIRMI
jgi:histidinol dehydrogenase